MPTDRLRRLLEGVKELKRQYYVSSYSSLLYLRQYECYRKLWEGAKRHYPTVRFTVREFTNVLDAAARVLQYPLSVEEINAAEFPLLIRFHSICCVGEFPKEEMYDVRTVYWRVDYEKLSEIVLREIAGGRNVQDMLLKCLTMDEEPIFLVGGDAKSLAEIKRRICAYQKAIQVQGGIPEWCAQHYGWHKDTNPAEIDAFHQVAYANIGGAISREELLEDAGNRLTIALETGSNLDTTTITEHRYLFEDEAARHTPIERSRKEQTRNCLETERRFALTTFLPFGEKEKGRSFENVFAEAIAHHARRLWMRSERLKKLIELKAPLNVIGKGRELVSDARYLLLCLKKNKRWLERVISR